MSFFLRYGKFIDIQKEGRKKFCLMLTILLFWFGWFCSGRKCIGKQGFESWEGKAIPRREHECWIGIMFFVWFGQKHLDLDPGTEKQHIVIQGSSPSKFGSVYLTQLTCHFQTWKFWAKICQFRGKKLPI